MLGKHWAQIRELIALGEFKFSSHALDEMIDDGVLEADIVEGVAEGVVIETYPDFPKAPCVLILHLGSMVG